MTRRILEKIEAFLLFMAAAALMLMMLSTSFDAVGREVFNSPLQGNFEVTGLYLMVILVFATLSSNYASNQHIRVDVFLPRLKRRLGREYTRLVAAICIGPFGFFAWSACSRAFDTFVGQEAVLGVTLLPVSLSYIWVALGTSTLTFRFLLDLVSPEASGGTILSPKPE